MKNAAAKVTFSAKPPAAVTWCVQSSPAAGTIVVGFDAKNAICRVSFAPGGKTEAVLKQWKKAWPKTTFAKADKPPVKNLAAAPLSMTGTPFQQKVWKALLAIPSGKTASYGDIARRIGKPKAARAVGAACGKNPVALIVPCHRVIASDGSLGGFSGGFAAGLTIKRELLESESVSQAVRKAA